MGSDIRAALMVPAAAGQETAEIFRREARALYETAPQDAAAMLLDAAYANDRDDVECDVVVRDLMLAIAICPDTLWVYSAARRLLLKLGLWNEAIDISKKELELSKQAEYRMALCLEAAQILWIGLGDLEASFAWVQRGLEQEPSHVGALYMALWLSIERGKTLEAADYAVHLSKILSAPSERSVLYRLAGKIHADISNSAQAYSYYNEAVLSDRGDLFAHLHLSQLEEKFSKHSEAAQSYAQAAQIVDSQNLSAALYARAAKLNFYGGQLEKSAFHLLEAHKRLCPSYTLIMLEAEVCERIGNHQRAAELLLEIIEMTPDSSKRAPYFVTLSDIYAYGLGDKESSIEALAMGIACDPSLHYIYSRLAAAYESLGQYTKLAAVLKARAQIEEGQQREASLWLMAQAHFRSGQYSEAVEALTLIGESAIVRYLLYILYEILDDHRAHAHALDTWYRLSQDEGTRLAVLSQLLVLLTEKVEAPEIAIQYFGDGHFSLVSRDIAFRQIKLLRTLSHDEDLLRVLLELGASTEDLGESQMWKLEAAMICDRDLKDAEHACQILEELNQSSPHFYPAIAFRHGIALRDGAFSKLIEVNLSKDVLFLGPREQAETACENAWACLRMGNDERAIEYFEIAERLQALDSYYLRLYLQVLKRLGRWKDVERVISESIQALVMSSERKQEDLQEDDGQDDFDASENEKRLETEFSRELDFLHESLIDLRSFCLGRPVGVSLARLQHFKRFPNIQRYLDYMIEKLLLDHKDTWLTGIIQANTLLEAVDASTHALLQWVMAEITRSLSPEKLSQQKASSILMMLQAGLDKPYASYLRADILRVHRELPHGDVAVWLERYADMSPDKWMSTELRREASLRYSLSEKDLDAARRASSIAFKSSGNDWQSLWEFERFSAITEDWQALGILRERLAQLESDATARLQVLKTALVPYIDDNLIDHGVRVAQECLKNDPHTIVALVTLAHVAEDAGDYQSLANIADRLSEASRFSDNRLSYGMWAAHIWYEKLGRSEQALASLSHLLSHDPSCPSAISMSESLLEEIGAFESLSHIYTRAIAATEPGLQQMDLLRKQAKLLSTRLNDVPSASLALARILKQDAKDEAALMMQSELYIAQERWSEASTVIEQYAQVTTHTEKKRAANLKLSEIFIHQLNQADKAKRILRKHLNQFTNDIKALHLLYDIALAERNWLDAKVTLEAICHDGSESELRWARLAFTRIAREAGWSHDLRTLYERQAIEAIIGHRSDFDILVDDYRAHTEIDRLITVARMELGQLGDLDRIAQYRGCIAALLVANGQHREALAFLSEIIHDAQHTDWAYLARAQALYSAGQLESAASEFRRTLSRNIQLNDAYAPFIDVLKQIGDDVALASVLALRQHRTPTKKHLEFSRCVQGTPRGFFDLELISIDRKCIEAQRYLRMMTPYIFPIFATHELATELDSKHWTIGRCRQLFGQNYEVKASYTASFASSVELAKVKLDVNDGLCFDSSIVFDPGLSFDFWAAYAMHQAVTGACVLDILDEEACGDLFSGLCEAKPESPKAQILRKQIFKYLPRGDRKLFKDGVPFKAPDWSEMRSALKTRAACIGAIISASPAYALHAVPNDSVLQKFLISDSYGRLVRMYWGCE